MLRILRFVPLAVLLAGCAARPVAVVPQLTPPMAPAVLTSVLGKTAPQLVAVFGPAALDIKEAGARKFQFRSATCVLDAYLYAPAGGGEPVVTYVDARLPDGRDIDRASCVAAIAGARRGG